MYSITSLCRQTCMWSCCNCTHCAGSPGRWLELYVLYDLIVKAHPWGGWNCMYSMTSLCRLTSEVAGTVCTLWPHCAGWPVRLLGWATMSSCGRRASGSSQLAASWWDPERARESRVRQRARQRKKDWEVLLIYSIMQTSSTVVCNIITGSMRTIDEGFIKKRRQRSYLFNPLPC